MIKLNNTPIEGSTVKVNLGFRDSAGQYYIPAKITYTFLALNNDRESWSVVDNLYEVALTPASSVTLTIPDVKTITGTTLQRKIMVYWDAFVDNEYNSFVDEITFDIAPRPYVPNPPAPQPEPTIYVKINSVSMQIGTLSSVPVTPVFLVKTNLPVKIDNAVAQIITQGGEALDCNMTVDGTGALLTVNTDHILEFQTSYTLKIGGLVSTINDYIMENDFKCAFATQSRDVPHELIIEASKTVTLNENGTHIVNPDSGFDAIEEVVVNVDVQMTLQDKVVTENGEVTADTGFDALRRVTVNVQPPLQTKIVSNNGEVEPDNGYYGLSKVTVNVPAPKPEQTKSITIIDNGTQTVEPDEGKVLSSVEINTEIPIQTGRTETITANGTTLIEPGAIYAAMEDVEVTVAVPLEANKTETLTSNGTHEITPTAGNTAMEKTTVTVAVPIQTGRTETITSNGTTTINPSSRNVAMDSVEVVTAVPIETEKTETIEHNGTVTITPSAGNVAMDEVEVTVAVPLEANKASSISVEDYTQPVEITPTAGNDGMQKNTVTLTNIPNVLYAWRHESDGHILYTCFSNVSKSTGIGYQCGQIKNAALLQKSVVVSGDGLYIEGWASSVYDRYPDGDIF